MKSACTDAVDLEEARAAQVARVGSNRDSRWAIEEGLLLDVVREHAPMICMTWPSPQRAAAVPS